MGVRSSGRLRRTPDQVYLTGNLTEDMASSFVQNIQLTVMDGRSGARYTSQLKYNAGYNARLFLGDFTGERVDDILSIDSGGSGAFTYNYIYSFMQNVFHELYNNEWFYETYSDASDFYEDKLQGSNCKSILAEGIPSGHPTRLHQHESRPHEVGFFAWMGKVGELPRFQRRTC